MNFFAQRLGRERLLGALAEWGGRINKVLLFGTMAAGIFPAVLVVLETAVIWLISPDVDHTIALLP